MTLERARRLVSGDLVWGIGVQNCIDVGEVGDIDADRFVVRWEHDRKLGVFCLNEETWQLRHLFADKQLWPRDNTRGWPLYPSSLRPHPMMDGVSTIDW